MGFENTQPIKLVVAALGGQGGGVLVGWIAQLARNAGWPCQTTSVPGVAQRTGATIYYLEMLPIPRDQLPSDPVLSLFPTRGDVDIVVASEVVEAGRMIDRGFVTPERTSLIASSHRVYVVSERTHPGDATIDANSLREIAHSQSKQLTMFDMQHLADKHFTIVSAVLFGALAGARVLPFEVADYEAIIQGEGNRAAFKDAYEAAVSPSNPVEIFSPEAEKTIFTLPKPTSPDGAIILERIKTLPQGLHETVFLGAQKLADYLDHRYAGEYLDQVIRVVEADSGNSNYAMSREFARQLALWSSFEDIIRVAHLKIRKSRVHNLAGEVGLQDKQILHVRDFFKPRVEEICGLMPLRIGQVCMKSTSTRRLIGLFTSGKQLASTNIWIFLSLRLIAGLRRFRRGTYAFVNENARRQAWLDTIHAHLEDPQKAHAIIRFAALVRGYGATRERGYAQMAQMLSQCANLTADTITRLHDAALDDDQGVHFKEQFVNLQLS